MTKEKYLEFCKSISGAVSDMPFREDFTTVVLRHWDNRKWFGLVMEHNGKEIVNLKLSPDEVLFYRDMYGGITEAYHMNKTHWITLYLDSDVPDEEIKNLTMISFELTASRKKR